MSGGILQFQGITIANTGRYTCIATNRYGQAEAVVEVLVEGFGLQPPQVEVRPQYLTITEGDAAEFQCSASGIPTPDIRWTPDIGRQLSPQVYYSGGILRIPSVRKSDEGRYTCSANNTAGEDRRTVYLYVESALHYNGRDMTAESPEPTVQLTMEPSSYNGLEGGSVFLRCLAGAVLGAPAPRLTWSRQGGKLPNNARQDDDGRGSATLVITSSTSTDSGVYICTAIRTTPPSYATDTVRVVVTAYRQPPVVGIEPERQTVAQGSLAELRCVASGDPTPAITWSKAHEELSSNTQAVGPMLRIPNVQVQDRGIYICTADSLSGTSLAFAMLEVERREAPRVSLFPTEQQTVISGRSTLLQCHVEAGIPTPAVVWSRVDGRPLPPTVEELSGGVLRFTGMTKADEGSYLCVARNDAGEARVTGSIAVQTPPQITLLPSQQVSVNAGQSVRLECRSTGDPMPTVFWQVDQRRALSAESVARPSVAILEITSVSRADEGSYSCLAQNAAGSAEDRLNLTVVDGAGVSPPGNDTYYPYPYLTTPPDIGGQEPSADGNVKQTPRPGSGLTESSQRLELPVGGSGDLRSYPSELPKIRIQTDRQMLRPGDSARIECSVVGGTPPIDIRWEAVGRSLPPSVTMSGGILQFQGITIANTGRYTCVATNRYGRAEGVVEVLVEGEDGTPLPGESDDEDLYPGSGAGSPDIVVLTTSSPSTLLPGKEVQPPGSPRAGVSPPGNDTYYPYPYPTAPPDIGGQESSANGDVKHTPRPGSGLTESSQRLDLPVGGGGDIRCAPSGHDPQTDRISLRWIRPDNQQLPRNSYKRDGVLSLRDVQHGDEGEYVCQGVGPTGSIIFSTSIYVELIELPKIRIQTDRQMLRPGDSARVECSVVGGTPPIDIRWEAVGRSLPPSVTMSSGILQFHGITVTDTGRYMCVATDRYGQAEGVVEVLVEAVDLETEAGFQGDGWVELPGRLMAHADPQQREQLTIEFSTTNPDGILFWHGQEPEASGRGQDYLALAVANGSVELSYELGSGAAHIRYPLRVDDGRTHMVVAERQATHGSLSVDNGAPEFGESGGLRAMLNTDGNIYIGGVPNPSLMTDGRYLSGLTGCVHAVYIDQDTEPLYLRELAVGDRNVRACDSDSDIDNELYRRRQRGLTTGEGRKRKRSGKKA